MIKIEKRENELHIVGHTLPDICAAVSSVTTTIINCMIELCDENDYEYEYSSGDCTIKVLKETDNSKKLFSILITELTDMTEDYPDYIKFV
jgi:uncharacterized protein YsxB (DUF464 family)